MLYDAAGPIQRVSVAAVAAADLKAAVTGKKIRLLGGFLVAGAAGATFSLKSNTTVISGAVILAANAVLSIVPSGIGYCDTVAGEKLALDLTAGAISGVLTIQIIN